MPWFYRVVVKQVDRVAQITEAGLSKPEADEWAALYRGLYSVESVTVEGYGTMYGG